MKAKFYRIARNLDRIEIAEREIPDAYPTWRIRPTPPPDPFLDDNDRLTDSSYFRLETIRDNIAVYLLVGR